MPAELGALVREHRASWRGEKLPVIATTTLALLPWLALWRSGIELFAAIAGGAMFGAVAVVAFIHGARDASTQLAIHECGVTWRRGRQQGRFLFTDVKRVYLFAGAIRGVGGKRLDLPPTGVRIDLADGTAVRLPASMSDFDELLITLRAGEPRAALPAAVARSRR
jgi:hypothetical protein